MSPAYVWLFVMVLGSGPTAAAQEVVHSPGRVFGDPFQGDTWLVTADPVVHECCASYGIANALIVDAWSAVRASLDQENPDAPGATHARAAGLRQGVRPEDAVRYRRMLVDLRPMRREWLARLAALTESVYGSTSLQRGIVLESLSLGESSLDRRPLSFAPRHPDYLVPWIHHGPSKIESVARPMLETSAMLAALFEFAQFGLDGDTPSLRRSMWGCLAAVASTVDQFEPGLRSVRVQNALGLSLLARAVERESLIDGRIWGSGFRGTETTQRVRAIVRPEEINALEGFVEAAKKFRGILSSALAGGGMSKAEAELAGTAGKEFTLALARIETSLGLLRTLAARCADGPGDGVIELVGDDAVLQSLAAWRVEPLGAEGRSLDFMISGNEEGVASLDQLNADARRGWVAEAAGGVRLVGPALDRCRLFLVPLRFEGGPEGPLLWK